MGESEGVSGARLASDERGFTANIAALFTSSASANTSIRAQGTAESSKSYFLQNSAELFEEAMGQAATRRWVEGYLEQSNINDLYMVVGLKTLTDSRQAIIRGSGQLGKGSIQLPTNTIMPGSSLGLDPSTSIDIGLQHKASDTVATNQPHHGEYICAVEYQKIRNKTFNFFKKVKLDKLFLQKTTIWRHGAVQRGGFEGDSEDEEDGISVTLVDPFDDCEENV